MGCVKRACELQRRVAKSAVYIAKSVPMYTESLCGRSSSKHHMISMPLKWPIEATSLIMLQYRVIVWQSQQQISYDQQSQHVSRWLTGLSPRHHASVSNHPVAVTAAHNVRSAVTVFAAGLQEPLQRHQQQVAIAAIHASHKQIGFTALTCFCD